MEWLDTNQIKIDPPKRPKKITGTRFAAILNKNVWNSPFKTWCEITRTYEEPFEDTIYTIAGKTIEPKQADYMKEAYFMDIVSPTDIYGADYFKKTFGDFFGKTPVFGGMWDYLLRGEDGEIEAVLEMKTTKRSEDWVEDVPEYYALQAALYANLLGVDKVIMVASILEDKDYSAPEKFVPSAENTVVIPFRVSERYPDFNALKLAAMEWWEDYVLEGISPPYNEKRDEDVLKALRSQTLNPDTDLDEVIAEAEQLQEELDEAAAEVAEKEKRLKTLKDIIRDAAVKQFRDGDKSVTYEGANYKWTVSKAVTATVDKDKLKADGILGKYQKETVSYKLTNKHI